MTATLCWKKCPRHVEKMHLVALFVWIFPHPDQLRRGSTPSLRRLPSQGRIQHDADCQHQATSSIMPGMLCFDFLFWLETLLELTQPFACHGPTSGVFPYIAFLLGQSHHVFGFQQFQEVVAVCFELTLLFLNLSYDAIIPNQGGSETEGAVCLCRDVTISIDC